MSDEQKKEKPYVAMWDYQNADEDFERRLVIDVTPLMTSDMPDQGKTDIIMAIDETLKHLLRCYNVSPKPGINDNKLVKKTETDQTVEK